MARTFLSAPPTERVGRYPKHTFQTKQIPFTIQPFFIAPVLPGETLSSLFFESRVVTDPVKNRIIGWKHEYYFFYVRMSDLKIDAFKELFVDPANADLITSTALETTAQVRRTYAAKGSIDWTDRCLTRIVDEYFRDEGEVTADYVTSVFQAGSPFVQIREQTFLDSITTDATMPAGDAIAGATNADDLDRLMDAFEQLRAMGLSDMTYEDWLRSNGIAVPGKDEGRPELLGRFSEFQYPSNAIEPTTGAASSAVSWVFKNGIRKPAFFKEPGFLIGVSICRPKLYFRGLAGSACGFMTRAWDWMPNYLQNMPETSLKYFAADTGPLGDRTTPTDDYWLDMRDILTHGDQFHNMADFDPGMAPDDANYLVPLPGGLDSSMMKYKYPTETIAKSFFVDSAGTKCTTVQDGYVSLSIKGKQVDYTSGTLARL